MGPQQIERENFHERTKLVDIETDITTKFNGRSHTQT